MSAEPVASRPQAPAARGFVKIDAEECKGCGLCIDACPPHCLELEPELSAYGVHPAHYVGEGCTGCGICFYTCPEPGAITVYRAAAKPRAEGRAETKSPVQSGRTTEAPHAPSV